MGDICDRAQPGIEAAQAEALERARGRLPHGTSPVDCERCGEPIGARRRFALPGVRICIECALRREVRARTFSGES